MYGHVDLDERRFERVREKIKRNNICICNRLEKKGQKEGKEEEKGRETEEKKSRLSDTQQKCYFVSID